MIALEGLDGVGKTTLGTLAAAQLGIAYVKSPPPSLNPVRGFIACADNPRASFYFYLAGLHALQDDLRSGITERRGVIVDRYLLSTIAYWDAGASFVPPAHDSSELIVPSLTIRVTCDEPLRQTRVRDRGFHIYDRKQVDEAAIDAFLKAECDLDFVNGDGLDESLNRLCSLIGDRLPV